MSPEKSNGTAAQSLVVHPPTVGEEKFILPRPSTTGSGFQPTGAFFKASRSKSDAELSSGSKEGLGTMQVISNVTSSVGQHTVMKTNHVRSIHNVTMTAPDKQHIILATATTDMGKPQRTHRQLTRQQRIVSRGSLDDTHLTINAQYMNTNVKVPVRTSALASTAADTTVSTTALPVPIASKVAVCEGNLVSSYVHSGQTVPSVQQQVVNEALPGTRHFFVAPVQNSSSGRAAVATQRAEISGSMNSSVPLSTTQSKVQTGVPPTAVLANVVLKPNQTQQTVNQTQIPLSTFVPRGSATHVQYILPSLTVQAGPGGKVQNVLQMALPCGSLQNGNIQLTAIPTNFVQTSNATKHTLQFTPVTHTQAPVSLTPTGQSQIKCSTTTQPSMSGMPMTIAAPVASAIVSQPVTLTNSNAGCKVQLAAMPMSPALSQPGVSMGMSSQRVLLSSQPRYHFYFITVYVYTTFLYILV